ncbi:MAG: cell division protein FtsQ/DivIB [Pauljensenia sp.]
MRLRGTHILILVCSVAVLAGVVWGVLFSPLLALSAEEVAVSGADEDVSAQVSQAVAPFIGTPLPRLDTGAVVAAVEEVPLVRSAEATRQWPEGLSVVVQTRVAALAEKDGDGVDLVDDQGVAVSHADEVPDGMPLVTLPAAGDDRVRAAGAAESTWAALPEDVRAQVEQLSADGHMVTLALSGGRTVRWGTGEDGPLKAKVLAVLLAQRAASVYDVSDPTRPVTS